jgi:Tfp pilus assembly protein PilF/DNA polymerase III delta prime subunit
MMERQALSKEYVADKLKDLLADVSVESPAKWDYCKAAAVLSYFDMNSIKPLGGREYDKREALESLLAESVITYDETHQPQWMLRPEVRRRALEQLAAEQNLRKALEDYPNRPTGNLQKTLEDYIFERNPKLEGQSVRQLLDTQQVAEWLHGLVAGVPHPEDVRKRLDMESLLAPFRFLVGNHFRGREAELNRLSAYVGVADPRTVTEAVKRAIEQILSLKDKPPLVIYGPGGMGKSTLLARFILLHLELNESRRFPCVYLDFDRVALMAEEPISLLLEVVRQLSIQYPDSKVSLEKARDKWIKRLKSQNAETRKDSPDRAVGDLRLANRSLFLDELAEEIRYLDLTEKPLLLVLDTFEEVQCRNKALVSEVFNFLNELQARIPRLRTVLSGRAKIELEGFAPINMPLTAFDPPAAQGFLMSHGVSDAQLAARVASCVGGSPLTLRLAAELLQKEEYRAENFDLFAALREEAIQAQLYRRILGHIRNERVKKLAHPGLVLRRITPELIKEVLAVPCNISVPDLAAARSLFHELAKEVALVEQPEGEVLIHRPELRLVMLDLLRETAREQVNDIHRGAIRFYERADDDVSRAEELYHRLSLGVTRDILKERWREGLDQYLAPVVHELPPKSQAFLVARMDLEVNEEIWNEADEEDWRLYTGRRARSLINLGRDDEALAILRAKPERDSRLHALETLALTRLKRFEEANTVAEAGFALLEDDSENEVLFDLSLYSAELDERLGIKRDPELIITRFDQLKERLGLNIGLVDLGLRYLRQYRDTSIQESLKKSLQAVINQLPRSLIAQSPKLIGDANALLKSEEKIEELGIESEFTRGGKDSVYEDKNVYQSAPQALNALHQLPSPPRDFTGRKEELEELLRELERGGVTISGLQGLGGVGKTTLALKLAQQLTPRYPDAQFYLDLKGTSRTPLFAGDAMAHIIRAYQPTVRIPESEAELSALYRSVLHNQRALLLMDNAADSKQVEPLIPPESCVMLVTSRRHFTLPGLFTRNLDTLPAEDARQLLLRITPRIGEQADDLARLCGYLPLALRLAASALAERLDLGVADYVRRLTNAQQRLKLIDASISLSYELLGPEMQARWRVLAIFPDTFDVAAAAAVWEIDVDAAQDTLSRLVVYSVVEWNSATARYRLHDLTRLFADARLSDTEKKAAQLLHATHYLSVMRTSDNLFINGGEGLKRGIVLFELEWHNIQAGQSWAQANSADNNRAASLASEYPIAGTYLLDLRLHPRERIRWLEAAFRATRRLKDRVAEGRHLNSLGVAYQDMGEVQRAIEFYERGLTTAREVGDQRAEGSALGNMASAYEALGEIRQAIRFNEERLALARKAGHQRGEGYALGSLGIAYAELGETQRSIEYLNQALIIFRKLGDLRSESISLINLGNVYHELEQIDHSIEYFEQALEISREIGDRRVEGQALASLGVGYAGLEDYAHAIEFYQQSLSITRELSDPRSEGAILGNLGLVYKNMGDFHKAVEFYGQQIAITREIGDRRGEANALGNMSMALDHLNDRARAIAYAEAALKIYEQIEDPYAKKVREQLAEWGTPERSEPLQGNP